MLIQRVNGYNCDRSIALFRLYNYLHQQRPNLKNLSRGTNTIGSFNLIYTGAQLKPGFSGFNTLNTLNSDTGVIVST